MNSSKWHFISRPCDVPLHTRVEPQSHVSGITPNARDSLSFQCRFHMPDDRSSCAQSDVRLRRRHGPQSVRKNTPQFWMGLDHHRSDGHQCPAIESPDVKCILRFVCGKRTCWALFFFWPQTARPQRPRFEGLNSPRFKSHLNHSGSASCFVGPFLSAFPIPWDVLS